MKCLLKNIALVSVLLILLALDLRGADSASSSEYINFPRAYEQWESKFMVGLGITKLPTQIVEEEINTSPIVFGNFRIGLPLNFSGNAYLSSNYISTIGTLGLEFNPLHVPLELSFGLKASMWFGHIEMESIRLKSYGVLIKPIITAGIDVDDLLYSIAFEVQYGFMKTYAEDKLLATFNQPRSGYALRFTLEQPFFNKQWVLLGIGLNYNTFYYQSWLSYSAIKSYLLYPEVYFGFII